MEWEEFLLSDEFAAYRRHQAEAIAKTVHAVLGNLQPRDFEWLKGAMDMAFKLVRIPLGLVPEKSNTSEQIGKQIEQDMADVTAYLISRSFNSSNEDD